MKPRWNVETIANIKAAYAAAACSLSQVLETILIPPKYFLSATACAGILRRAEKRGKKLPELLDLALRQAVDSAQILNVLEDYSQ